MTISVKWLAQSTIYRDSVDLLGVIDYGGADRDVVQPVVMEIKRVDRYSAVHEPTFALSPQSAQSLMQALWDAGIRPNDGEDSGAQVTALKKHIAFAEHVARTLLPAPNARGDL